ncbi:MAG: GAF domain-containing protein, partial [Myxococcota bacterium]
MPPGSQFVALLADLSTRFAGLPAQQVDAEIDRALGHVLDFLATDRISLIELRDEGENLFVAHSRIRPGTDGVPSVLGQTAATTWYAPKLRAGEIIRLDRLPDDLPPTAFEELDHAVRFAFRSHMAVPISIGGRWICALATATCVDYRSWSDETVQELRILGQILANALHRARLETELRESLRELRRLEHRLRAENRYLREEVDIEAGFEAVVGRSPSLRRALEQAAQVAETPTSVLLLGETGTGK